VFANKIPVWQKEIKDIKALYGDKILGTCTVEQAYGGMRSVKSMVYETSLLDPVEVP
jgi:citrate synthase